MIKTAWHLWTIGEDGLPAKEGAVVCETHVVPEVQRDRHTPIGCWCKPAKDIAEDGSWLITHRLIESWPLPE